MWCLKTEKSFLFQVSMILKALTNRMCCCIQCRDAWMCGGNRLHIGVLDVETGNLSIDGMVEAIIYRDEEKRKQRMSIWARIFR